MVMAQRSGITSTALALLPLAIAINIAGGQLVKILRLPIYLDSVGTVLSGVLLGPWIGLLTGALSNIIWTLIGLDTYTIWFAPVAAVIGLIAGFAGRAGAFAHSSPRWLSAIIGAIFLFALTLFVMMFIYATPNPDDPTELIWPNTADLFTQIGPLVAFVVALIGGAIAGYVVLRNAGYAGLAGLATGVVAAIISAPIATYVFGGSSGSGTDALVAAFRATGASILASVFAQGVFSDPFDKMTSFMIVWLIMQSLPRRLLIRFPNTQTDVKPISAASR
ncbi:MAG: ECF transporter S component [Chloroflexales bacterium]|nr:ECF transporter S component [Chloroflexales bacterium]